MCEDLKVFRQPLGVALRNQRASLPVAATVTELPFDDLEGSGHGRTVVSQSNVVNILEAVARPAPPYPAAHLAGDRAPGNTPERRRGRRVPPRPLVLSSSRLLVFSSSRLLLDRDRLRQVARL